MSIRLPLALGLFFVAACQHAPPVAAVANTALGALEAGLPGDAVFFVAAVNAPAAQAAEILDALASSGVPSKVNVLDHIQSPEQRREKLGFDPADAVDWARIGVDPSGGAAVAVLGKPDAALVVAIKVVDEAKLIAWANRRPKASKRSQEGPRWSLRSDKDGGRHLYYGEIRRMRWARRGPWTWLIAADDATFLPVVGPGEVPLAEHPVYRKYVGDGLGSGLVLLTAGIPDAFHKETSIRPDELVAICDGMAMKRDGDDVVWRSDLGAKGRAGFAGLFGADAEAPAAAQRLFDGKHSIFRLRIGLKTLVKGLLALTPEAHDGAARKALGNLQGALAIAGNAAGLGWPGLARAISGDLVLALPQESPAEGSPWYALGVVVLGGSDAAAVDTMIENLKPLVIQQLRGQVVDVAGRQSLAFSPRPGLTIHAVQEAGNLVLAASQPALERYLALAPATATSVLAGKNVVMGLHLLGDGTTGVGAQSQGVLKAFGRPSITTFDGQRLAGRTAYGFGFAPGLIGMIAIPNFIRFQCRAKQSGAKIGLASLRTLHHSFRAEHGAAPEPGQLGFRAPEKNRYAYCLAPDHCLPCSQECHGLTIEEAKAECSKAGAFADPQKGGQGAIGCAVGRHGEGGTNDVWVISSDGPARLLQNACGG